VQQGFDSCSLNATQLDSRQETMMQRKWMHTAFLLAGLAALGSTAARAQVLAAIRELSRTDVAGSLYGAFSGTTNGNGTTQSPSNAAGGLLEVRHIAKPWFGFEGSYSFNRANQEYSTSTYAVCGVCNTSTSWTPVSANAHEVTGDWVASLKISKLRPFALAGGGILLDVPSSGQATTTTLITGCGPGAPGCVVGTISTSTSATSTTTKGVFVYGAGLDWGLLPHIGLRLQYRGNLYKAPDLIKGFTSTNAFTHTSEPMIGIYFRL
jgi:opacity protein-like surface antigen